ncbi:MAG: DUF2510 domain-containing protein, partial [Actinomycetota bacterium]
MSTRWRTTSASTTPGCTSWATSDGLSRAAPVWHTRDGFRRRIPDPYGARGGSLTPEEATAPGWYPDPRAPGRVRYWDGSAWTELARPVGDRALLTLPRQGRPVEGRLAWPPFGPPSGPHRALA